MFLLVGLRGIAARARDELGAMRIFGAVALFLAGCVGASPSSTTPSSTTAAGAIPTPDASGTAGGGIATAKGTSTPTDDPGLPSECADPAAPVCTPPADFADRLCDKTYQDVALSLLSRTTPFTRGYLRGKLDELTFDEEVLIVHFHAPQKGGIVVGSNLGTYDVLRWDGSCSRGVEAEMVTRAKPASPRVARIRWNRMGTRTQDALVAASDTVKRARAKRGKECKGAMTGDVSATCDKADDALSNAVVDYVRSGGALPAPDVVP